MKVVIGISVFVVLIIGASLAYTLLGSQGSNLGNQITNPDGNSPREAAPDFEMVDSSGTLYKLSDFKGKPVVLNFWASWCSPCRVEMPVFDKVYKELGNEVQFVMLNYTDGQRETIGLGTQFISSQGYSFPIFFDNRLNGASAYGVTAIPRTVFIDKDGNVASISHGTINEEVLRAGIELIR